MQTQKLSLANIKGKLSRTEMKNIMAGSGSTSCSSGPCTLFVDGITYSGTCGFYSGNGSGVIVIPHGLFVNAKRRTDNIYHPLELATVRYKQSKVLINLLN